MLGLEAFPISGATVLPLVEGGKGIGVSNGASAGAWAAAGGVGTFSGVNADLYDAQGNIILPVYKGRTRAERHEELVSMGIRGAIEQARIAYETASGKGRVHMNVLWEMGGAERILEGVLEGARGLIHGITCGAGMPYRLGEIAAQYKVWYYPIVSSARAFRALWKRSYSKVSEWLGGVVYEDPWLAGGHNGLSNVENPEEPQKPFPRVKELRDMMRSLGVREIPIFMAGGVWFLREWRDWIGNPELGPVAFQFGTRPLLTKESPVSDLWKKALLTLKKGDVLLHRFSPTGFYSSAVKNSFLAELVERSDRQVSYRRVSDPDHCCSVSVGARGRQIFVSEQDRAMVERWIEEGFAQGVRTPDQTMIFVTPQKAAAIVTDQQECMGCLSACSFSNWSQFGEGHTTGHLADPRSFCIQKTLQAISRGGNPEQELMFAGHNAYRFGADPFYREGFIPTVRQLLERIQTGD